MTAASLLTDTSGAARAIDRNVIELWHLICAALPNAEFHEEPGATWFVSGSDVAPWLNQVLRTDVAPEDADAHIDELIAAYAARGAPPPYWCVEATAQPDDLAVRLQARGFVQASDMPGMAIELAALPEPPALPQGVSLMRVRDAGGLELWARGYIDAFGMEEAAGRVLHGAYAQQPLAGDAAPLIHYAALRAGRPIASATTFLGAGVAGVWHVGVLEAERRQGIGAAVTLAGLYDARALGFRISTLYSSAMGYPVYKRLGYRDCTRMLQYVKETPA